MLIAHGQKQDNWLGRPRRLTFIIRSDRAAKLILPIHSGAAAYAQPATCSREEQPTWANELTAIEWFERMASDGRLYQPELAQLSLSVATIHPITDQLTQLILELAMHPEMFEPLRKEIA